MKSLLFAAVLASVAAVAAGAAEPDPLVRAGGGAVRGQLVADGAIAVFKGIPYAAPPVGALRWKDPQAVAPWKGVLDAKAYGPACIQEGRRDNIRIDEDCLHLNIWSPGWPAKSHKPVMFWIFGGGNKTGTASSPTFDGAALARRGVVVVTIDFRLGLFGNFVHPELTAESPHHGSGNYGLKDQLAALKWVHANIARFGGDPGNITVFGQSSGSWDTFLLVASPQSSGLMARAIAESGPGYPMATLAEAEGAGTRFAASLKAPSGAGQVNFLRGLSAEALQKAASQADKAAMPNMGPSIDGWYMPAHSSVMFSAGREHKVPMIIGSNAQEMAGPPPEGVRKAVSDAFGINADKALAYYGLTNGGAGKVDPLFGSVGKQVAADGLQRCGSVQMAVWHSAPGTATYEYQFDRPLPGRAATQHAAEVPFVFGNIAAEGGAAASEADYKASNEIQTYWTNFAKTGNPNGAGLPDWSKFDPKARSYLEFTVESGPVPKQGLRREICDLYMENVASKMASAR